MAGLPALRTRLNARMTNSSSPRSVLPATSTGRFGDIRKKRSTRSRPRLAPSNVVGLGPNIVAGPGGAAVSTESNFKLPVIVIRAGSAPSATNRRAVSSLCTQK